MQAYVGMNDMLKSIDVAIDIIAFLLQQKYKNKCSRIILEISNQHIRSLINYLISLWKGLYILRAIANFCFLNSTIFLLEEFSRVKKSVCQNIWTSSLYSVENKIELFYPLKVLTLHEFFSSGVMMDWLGKKVEVEDGKNGKIQNNTWQYDCVFWERMMEEMMKRRRTGFGLRLELMYRLEKLLGNVAN